MAEPRYIYFNIRARGELPRLVAAAGGVKYQDDRIKMSDWPGDLKAKTPYGQLPCLVIGDRWYAQKMAIALYFARKCGLYPTTGSEVDALKIDHVLNFTEEILENFMVAFRERRVEKKADAPQKLVNEVLPAKLAKLEAILKTNEAGFFVGSKLSIVELSAFDVLEHLVDVAGKEYLDAYPKLKSLYQRVADVTGVKKYLASRPKPEDGFDF